MLFKKLEDMDERDLKNIGIASLWAIRAVILYTVGKAIYYFQFRTNENLYFMLWDGILLAIIALIIFAVTRTKKTYSLPETPHKEEVEIKKGKVGREERIQKSYLPKTFRIAGGMVIGSLLGSGFESILVTITLFIIYFILSFIVVFAWGEMNVRSHNKSLEE